MVVGADDFLQDVMIQTNGFGFLLCTIMYSAMAVISSGMLLKAPRSKRSMEIQWKNSSTMFNQDAEVGVDRIPITGRCLQRIPT